jgi:hypothetical protein
VAAGAAHRLPCAARQQGVLQNLYGRLPCGKWVFEGLTRRVHCGLISGLLMQFGQRPLLALMVIREVGAHLAIGLALRPVPVLRQLYQPTV